MSKIERVFRIDLYPQDWLVSTSRMTLEQRGIFIQICCMIYANRGPIVNDPDHIGRASNCSSRLARSLILQLVSAGDLKIEGSKITQTRCERELNSKQTALELSAKGGRKKAENERELIKNNDLTSSEQCVSLSTPSPSPSPTTIEANASIVFSANETDPTQPDLLKGNPSEQPIAHPAKPVKPVKRKCQLPDDWQPNDQHRRRCSELGITVNELAEQFKDYHRARGTVFTDWDAGFRTWIGNAPRFSGARLPQTQPSGANGFSGGGIKGAGAIIEGTLRAKAILDAQADARLRGGSGDGPNPWDE